MSRLIILVVILSSFGCKSAPEPAKAEPAEPTEVPAPTEVGGEGDMGHIAEGPAPVVITDAEAEHRTAPNGKASITKLVTGNNAFLGKLEMDADGKVPLHRDPTEEYIYVLQGSGVIQIDGKSYNVVPNSAIFMPANAEVTFQGGGKEKLVAIQVFAGPEPSAKYDKWTPVEK